jgi:hypothetical protein
MLFSAAISTVAEVATAIGTLFAVLLALYFQAYREWKARPSLSLSLGRNKTGLGLGSGVADEAHSVGLRVTAARKRRTAHDVEVFATAEWHYPEANSSHRFIDHEPLQWIGGSKTDRPTVLSLGPGVSREVSLLRVGRPLDLYPALGLPRPTLEDLKNGKSLPSAFATVDVSQVGTFGPFLENHLTYRFRFDVTAKDVDTVSCEAWVRIDQRWEGPTRPSGDETAQTTQGVEIVLDWSPLRRVVDADDVPNSGKLWIGSPPFKD